jgi:hypothetical protein
MTQDGPISPRETPVPRPWPHLATVARLLGPDRTEERRARRPGVDIGLRTCTPHPSARPPAPSCDPSISGFAVIGREPSDRRPTRVQATWGVPAGGRLATARCTRRRRATGIPEDVVRLAQRLVQLGLLLGHATTEACDLSPAFTWWPGPRPALSAASRRLPRSVAARPPPLCRSLPPACIWPRARLPRAVGASL